MKFQYESLNYFKIVMLLFLPITLAKAESTSLTCKNIIVEIDLPDYLTLEKTQTAQEENVASTPNCTFWENNIEPDYSGYYFGGAVMISLSGDKSSYKFHSTSMSKTGTWDKLISEKSLLINNSKNKYIRIDKGVFKSKYLAKISEDDTEERIQRITRIEGKVFDKNAWIKISLAIPYKDLTESQAIKIVNSIRVVHGN